MIASALTDFPLPDSPTSATVLFAGTTNEIPLTASKKVFLPVLNETRKLSTSRRGTGFVPLMRPPCFSFGSSASRKPSVNNDSAVTRTRHGSSHRRQLPPLPENQFVLRLIEHAAP